MDLFDHTTEIWKVIPFAPNYAVSSIGRLRRLTGGSGAQVRILRPGALDRYGYVKAKVFVNGKRVHTTINRLMAFAFLGEPPSPAHQAAHGDGIRTHNIISNIRWATPKENAEDTARHGTLKGARHPNSRLTVREAVAIRELRLAGATAKELFAQYGVSKSQLLRIKNGQSWHFIEASVAS
jgi:hypothetical protein